MVQLQELRCLHSTHHYQSRIFSYSQQTTTSKITVKNWQNLVFVHIHRNICFVLSLSLSFYSYIFAFNPLSILKTATNLVCFNTVFISKTVRFQTDSVFATSLFKQFIVQRVHSFFPQNSKKNNKVLIVVVQAITLTFFVSIEKRVSEVGFYCALDCDECRNYVTPKSDNEK